MITPFHPSHLGAINPASPSERDFISKIDVDTLARLAAEESLTVWVEGRPIACCGVLGGVELWAALDHTCYAHRRALIVAARKVLSGRRWLYAGVALEARCERFAEHFGFKFERWQRFAGVERRIYVRAR